MNDVVVNPQVPKWHQLSQWPPWVTLSDHYPVSVDLSCKNMRGRSRLRSDQGCNNRVKRPRLKSPPGHSNRSRSDIVHAHWYHYPPYKWMRYDPSQDLKRTPKKQKMVEY